MGAIFGFCSSPGFKIPLAALPWCSVGYDDASEFPSAEYLFQNRIDGVHGVDGSCEFLEVHPDGLHLVVGVVEDQPEGFR